MRLAIANVVSEKLYLFILAMTRVSQSSARSYATVASDCPPVIAVLGQLVQHISSEWKTGFMLDLTEPDDARATNYCLESVHRRSRNWRRQYANAEPHC